MYRALESSGTSLQGFHGVWHHEHSIFGSGRCWRPEIRTSRTFICQLSVVFWHEMIDAVKVISISALLCNSVVCTQSYRSSKYIFARSL